MRVDIAGRSAMFFRQEMGKKGAMARPKAGIRYCSFERYLSYSISRFGGKSTDFVVDRFNACIGQLAFQCRQDCIEMAADLSEVQIRKSGLGKGTQVKRVNTAESGIHTI